MRKGLVKKIVIGVLTSVLAMCIFGALTSLLTKGDCDHEWDDGVVVKEASCYASGLKMYTCLNCEDVKNEKITKIAHEWIPGEVVSTSTCKESGRQQYACSTCGEVDERVLPLVAHAYEQVLYEEPTTTATGREVIECTVCGHLVVTALPMLESPTANMVEVPLTSISDSVADKLIRVYKPSKDSQGLTQGGREVYLCNVHDSSQGLQSLSYFYIFDDGLYFSFSGNFHKISIPEMVIAETDSYIDFSFAKGTYEVFDEDGKAVKHICISDDTTFDLSDKNGFYYLEDAEG